MENKTEREKIDLIFRNKAEEIMISYNHRRFKEDYPTLFRCVIATCIEYTKQQLVEKDKEIEEFAIGFAKWIRENGYGYSKKFNLYQKSLINETIFFYEKELIELYKQSLNK